MRHWLLKSEPEGYGLHDLERDGITQWSGVRSFQARNNMLAMKIGDYGFFYHSSIKQPAAVGIVEIIREAYPDFTAWDKKSEYYDSRSSQGKPIWHMVDVKFVERLARPVTLAEMRAERRLGGMALLRRGQRLSVQPLLPREWNIIIELSATKGADDGPNVAPRL
ncbi:MAG: EVE domain-containing protein [Candidatus Eremiobacteraeota bacterium]|nr:EVE domain-containing protein [Candidatus Eremiobacteraeota bacterium]MBC5826162.1 EVE domain-containing protein [Candidatus Eremiobacteraeota bacterium]